MPASSIQENTLRIAIQIYVIVRRQRESKHTISASLQPICAGTQYRKAMFVGRETKRSWISCSQVVFLKFNPWRCG
jgi:hypothetical protein